MTFSHEDANARLLDLVYGEAPPAEREALQAHVATCATCQAELEVLGDTRARLRVALDDQPVPTGAHARILAAAAAEASNGAQAGAAATAPPSRGNDPASRAARTEEQPSFWDRLRSKWTFPTLAGVGALAVAMLVLGPKIFMSPEKVMERGQQDLIPKDEARLEAEESAKLARPMPVAPAPAPTTMPAESAGEPMPPREEEKQRELSPQMRARIESVRRYNKPRNNLGDLLNNQPSFKADKLGGAPASQAIGGLRPDDMGRGKGVGAVGGGSAGPGAEPPAEKKAAKGSLDDLLDGASNKHYASPPSGWKSSSPAAPSKPAASPSPAPKPTVAKKKAVEDDMLEGLSSRSAHSAPARSQEAEADEESREEVLAEGALAKRKSASAPTPAPAAPRAEPPAPPPVVAAQGAKAAERPADDKKEKDAAPSYQALAKRADELYAAQRWAEAAAAYNDLVRRFPTAEPASLARWRARMAVAQREAAPRSAPAAKAAPPPAAKASKKSVSDDALEGLR